MTHLGKLLWKSRLKERITCYTIARGMGYTNTNKGARKYLRWERGEEYPAKEQLQQLIQVMKLNPKQVQKAVERDRRDYEKWLDEPIPITLVVRMTAGFYVDVEVPENLSPEEAEEWAREYARKANLRVCLVKSRRESIYFDKNGDVEFIIPERPYMMIKGRPFGFGLLRNSETITPRSPRPDHPLCKRGGSTLIKDRTSPEERGADS